MKLVTILGVKVSITTRREALEKVAGFFNDRKQHTIFTPNPEMVVKAQKDEYFGQVLNSGDLNVCDGFGLWLAVRVESRKSKVESREAERIPGTDFMLDICGLAEKEGRSVYLLGSGRAEVVKKTVENLQKLFPRLKIAGYDKGPTIAVSETPPAVPPLVGEGVQRMTSQIPSPYKGEDAGGGYNGSVQQMNLVSDLIIDPTEQVKILKAINTAQPAILFVAFGMGKQEKWIYENLSKIPSVKLAMGVGGAFDYISGTIPRAPRLLRTIGLEWVYRLFVQPERMIRIWNATVSFMCYLLME